MKEWCLVRESVIAVEQPLRALADMTIEEFGQGRKDGERAAASASVMLSVGYAAAALLLIVVAFSLVRSIERSLRSVNEEAKRLTDAVSEGTLDVRAVEEKVAVDFRPVVQGLNVIMEAFTIRFRVVVEDLKSIARGVLPSRCWRSSRSAI